MWQYRHWDKTFYVLCSLQAHIFPYASQSDECKWQSCTGLSINNKTIAERNTIESSQHVTEVQLVERHIGRLLSCLIRLWKLCCKAFRSAVKIKSCECCKMFRDFSKISISTHKTFPHFRMMKEGIAVGNATVYSICTVMFANGTMSNGESQYVSV